MELTTYILYLDDSGSVGNANEEYFVLGGVCVPEASVRWLANQVDQIACEIEPAAPESVELHAAEIFGGRRSVWAAMKEKSQRIALIKRVLRVLDNANSDIAAFAYAIHKASYRDQDLVQLAFEDLSSRLDLFLQRKAGSGGSAKGIIVLDKSSYETNLQMLAANVRRTGNRWGSQTRNICEVPMFVDSTAPRNIQLADHIAYAVFRRYNANDLTYFDCIENRFDQDDQTGVIHGLVHKQTVKRHCTCPACLTRRDTARNTQCY